MAAAADPGLQPLPCGRGRTILSNHEGGFAAAPVSVVNKLLAWGETDRAAGVAWLWARRRTGRAEPRRGMRGGLESVLCPGQHWQRPAPEPHTLSAVINEEQIQQEESAAGDRAGYGMTQASK